MLPGLALGALVAWIGVLLALPPGALLLVASLVAATVLVIELAAILNLLGARIDRLDVSTELR
jgi:hypothetical protein